MSDPRNELASRFYKNGRFTNFGNVINRVVIRGVRCHSDTVVKIESPITSFSGLNGTGKTTLLQLAAAAFKSSNNYTINSFLTKSPLDHAPFSDSASVQFNINDQNTSFKSLTLSYNPKSQRWQGYNRRQEREVFFFGVGFFLPQNEKRDFVYRNAKSLKLGDTHELDQQIRDWCTRILSNGYDGIQSTEVYHRSQRADVLSACKGDISYSEAHMGCGEGRVHTLVRTLEACPEKSLILLEEPEISLHQKAEYELGKYFIDLVNRRGHQILITTHSERLMRSLPQASLIYLHREENGIRAVSGIASSQAECLMTEGNDKDLTIIVEDEAAQIVLEELLRFHDNHFLMTVRIVTSGFHGNKGKESSGKDPIYLTMKTLKNSGIRMAAVLDGGEKIDISNSIYSLPGSEAPEEELIKNLAVRQMLKERYGLEDKLNSLINQKNCHDYFDNIGTHVSCDPKYIMREAARVYSGTVSSSTMKQLIQLLKETAAK